jgi:hypothetical protein
LIVGISDLKAQVCGTVNEEEEGRPEFQLQRYDYFGDGEKMIFLVAILAFCCCDTIFFLFFISTSQITIYDL